jgi:Ser/Thr protein kinase RdoA (MazF antagonist)
MMKLKHLFHNPDLALMLLKNWPYDESSLEMFQYYRISANAVYPFRQDGETCFLRFSPASEKRKENLAAELEFIGYLRRAHYQALEPVPSRVGELLVQPLTPWGEYYASVFKRVKGQPVSETNYEDEILFSYGAALGQLHQLSSQYAAPKSKRWTHDDVFQWMEETLSTLSAPASALDELRLLRECFAALPQPPGSYGLIHYDFETDNVFYDAATGSCSAIDFDAAMYHWYVMDIAQALVSLKREIPAGQFPHKQAAFTGGYRSRYAIDSTLFAALPLFTRFGNLYRYTGITRAIQDRWEHEPEWLAALRTKLDSVRLRDAAHFGKALEAAP